MPFFCLFSFAPRRMFKIKSFRSVFYKMPCSNSNLDNFFNRWSPQVSNVEKKEKKRRKRLLPVFFSLCPFFVFFFCFVLFFSTKCSLDWAYNVFFSRCFLNRSTFFYSQLLKWYLYRIFLLRNNASRKLLLFCTLRPRTYPLDDDPIEVSLPWAIVERQIRFCILSTRMDRKRKGNVEEGVANRATHKMVTK